MPNKVDSSLREHSHKVNATIQLMPMEMSAPKSIAAQALPHLPELIKALVWPALVAVLIIIYHDSVGKLLSALQDRFSQANKVSLGKLSFEISEKAREVGSADLAERIGALSPHSIELLLQSHQTSTQMLVGRGLNEAVVTLPRAGELHALEELESKNLIVFNEPLIDFEKFFASLNKKTVRGIGERDSFELLDTLNKEQRGRLENQGYKLTQSGLLAVEAVMKAVVVS